MAAMPVELKFVLKMRVDCMSEQRAIKRSLMKYVVELSFDVKGLSTILYHNLYLVR